MSDRVSMSLRAEIELLIKSYEETDAHQKADEWRFRLDGSGPTSPLWLLANEELDELLGDEEAMRARVARSERLAALTIASDARDAK